MAAEHAAAGTPQTAEAGKVERASLRLWTSEGRAIPSLPLLRGGAWVRESSSVRRIASVTQQAWAVQDDEPGMVFQTELGWSASHATHGSF